MMIAENSLLAWIELQKNRKINANQRIVLDVYQRHYPKPLTNWEVARELNWTINRVTPRTLELRRKGHLKHAMTITQNGRKADAYTQS